jgi:hypothetical protein
MDNGDSGIADTGCLGCAARRAELVEDIGGLRSAATSG